MSTIKKDFFKIIIISVFVFLMHVITINYQPVNSSYMFFKGADFLKINNEVTKIFFSYQANTLGFSYLINFFSNLTSIENFKIAKILSYISYFFITFGTYNLAKKFNSNILIYQALLLVILNPLVWNYGFRGTPDLLSFSLCLFSSYFLIEKKNLILEIFFSFLFAVGVILKPINGIYLFLILFFNYKYLIKFQITYYIKYLIIFFFLFIYFFYNFKNFGFIITPPQYSGMGFALLNFFNNFVYYIGFSFFFIFLYSFQIIFQIFKKIKKIEYFIFFIFGILIYVNLGVNKYSEISFGFLNSFLSKDLFQTIISINFLLFFFTFYLIFFRLEKYKTNRYLLYIFLTLLIFYLIISFFGPGAQRYLLSTIPLYIIFFLSLKNFKIINYFFIFLFLVTNFFIFGNYFNNNEVNTKIVNFLKTKNIIYETNPGPVGSHILHEFIKFYDENYKPIPEGKLLSNILYIIVPDKNSLKTSDVIFSVKSNYFNLFKKELFIIKKN